MKTEDLVVDQGGQGEVVEKVGEVLPDIGIAVFAQAFVVEPVHLGNLTRLVVAAENGNPLWVSDLESNKESDSLDGKVSSVNVITHEKVVCVWVGSTNLEQFHQIVELTVNITAYCDRALYWLDIRLVLKNFPCLHQLSDISSHNCSIRLLCAPYHTVSVHRLLSIACMP